MFPFYTERYFQGRVHGLLLGNPGYFHEQNLLFSQRQK